MTTKFNKDMYAKMRSDKDEPLSSIGKKGVRVTGKGPSVTPVTSATPIVSAIETVTAEDLKALNGVPFNVVANQQVHKLVQVICLCVFFSVLLHSCTDDFTLLLRC